MISATTWVSIALAILGIVKAILSMVEKRKSVEAAKATIILQGLREIDARIQKAADARSAAEREFDESGLSSSDKNLRD